MRNFTLINHQFLRALCRTYGAYRNRVARLTSEDPHYSLRKVRLSETERQVLVAMRLNADMPVAQVARRLKRKVGTVQHALSSLTKNNSIKPFYLFNTSLLGYFEYDVMGTTIMKGGNERKQFLAFLIAHPQISEVLEVGGKYDLVFTILARSPIEVDAVLQKIGTTFGAVLSNLSICTCLSYSLYPPRYLASVSVATDIISVKMLPLVAGIDDLDRTILCALGKRPGLTARDHANNLNLSISSYLYRITKLKKLGVIVGKLLFLAPYTYNFQSFRLNIALRGINKEIKARFAQFARQCRWVSYHIEWLGEWHYTFGLTVENAQDATSIATEIREEFGEFIGKVELLPVVIEHKVGEVSLNPTVSGGA